MTTIDIRLPRLFKRWARSKLISAPNYNRIQRGSPPVCRRIAPCFGGAAFIAVPPSTATDRTGKARSLSPPARNNGKQIVTVSAGRTAQYF
ncbi:MAG: hypothetical protein U0401_00555 [Anaerolineae bacterium]